jgi:hypothetical protein
MNKSYEEKIHKRANPCGHKHEQFSNSSKIMEIYSKVTAHHFTRNSLAMIIALSNSHCSRDTGKADSNTFLVEM